IRRPLVVEVENSRKRIEHLTRRAAIAPLLQPQVVVGADAGELRNLLATQSRHTADSDGRDPDLLRGDELAPGAQIRTEQVLIVHAHQATHDHDGAGWPCPPGTSGYCRCSAHRRRLEASRKTGTASKGELR